MVCIGGYVYNKFRVMQPKFNGCIRHLKFCLRQQINRFKVAGNNSLTKQNGGKICVYLLHNQCLKH
jgi:hypothetical protein